MSQLILSRQSFKVQQIVKWLDSFVLDPGYQRDGGIWIKGRQQLFIDSLLNGFDVPPLYLHRLRPPEFRDGRAATYAVIDGRQRLEALEMFASDSLRLAEDFRLLEEVADTQQALLEELEPGPGRFAGLRLSEMRGISSELAYRFFDYDIPVSVVDTEDTELIEELFFRLNEGVPLNPAEKRTRGELLRKQIIPLVRDENLFRCAGFRNARRRYEDLLLRLLYLRSRGSTVHDVADMKKTAIDEFASSFRPRLGSSFTDEQRGGVETRLSDLIDGVRPTLEGMNEVFEEEDVLLRQASVFLIYYLVLEELNAQGAVRPTRSDFLRFHEELQSLRGSAEETLTPDQRDALEFVAPLQETTTGSYTERKAQVLFRYLTGNLRIV